MSSYKYDSSVHVLDVASGESIPFHVEGEYASLGIFKWSPDSTKLAFSAAKENWDFGSGFAVYLIDMQSRSILLLIDQYENEFVVTNWVTNDKIMLADYYGEPYYELTISTGGLIRVTPTLLP